RGRAAILEARATARARRGPAAFARGSRCRACAPRARRSRASGEPRGGPPRALEPLALAHVEAPRERAHDIVGLLAQDASDDEVRGCVVERSREELEKRSEKVREHDAWARARRAD